MVNAPFLTLLDPRAKIKGSRDPLGLQPIWTKLGRQVVSNLTTVTTSLRGFSVMLLGLHFAERAIVERQAPPEQVADLFMKFEQLAAYSRVSMQPSQFADFSEDEIRGIQRVKKNLGKKHVWISTDSESQILSNQKTYGLWGLYSVAARNSSLIDVDAPRLTETARLFVLNEYDNEKCLTKHESSQILDFLCAEQVFEPNGKDRKLARKLAALFGKVTASERSFYRLHLVEGAGLEVQKTLWQDMFEAVNPDQAFSMIDLTAVLRCAQKHGHDDVAVRLSRIQIAEYVFAPAIRIFNFVSSRDGQTIESIASEVKSTCGPKLRNIDPAQFAGALDVLQGEIDTPTHTRLAQLARTLSEGEYPKAISLMMDQNKAVMQNRGGLPWITMKGKSVSVGYKENAGPLPSKDEIPVLWINTYFLNALKSIGYQVEEHSL